MKRMRTWALALAAWTSVASAAEPVDLARRTAELQSLRWGMFICWSFSTFSGTEWTPGVTNLDFFRATEVDTDQWARTAKEAGMGYILFLTKHHDGFCLWDTATTDRKVTKAPLGRDVLAELKKSCDRHGIKLALYFSEGEWRQPGGLDDPATPGPKRRNQGGANADLKKAQLRELLTQYGPIEYIWFDHAVGDGGLNHADTIAFCKALQPGCFVGFNHGEQEGADIRLGEMGKPGPLTDHGAAGPHMRNAPATTYRLAEFTYPILPPHKGGAMWFYSLPEHDGLVLPPEKLYRDYLGAVKHGNVFALDIGPDYRGRIRDIDVATLRKVGEMIRSKAPLPEGASLLVDDKVDWTAFLARQDLVFDTLPTQFDFGAFLGNGLMGAMIFREGDNRLRFETGRSDVTEHRRDNNRLPVGGLVLETAGAIRDGTMRLDLRNAEVRGTVATAKGSLKFRALVHTDSMALLIELESAGGETNAAFSWVPGHGQDRRNLEKFKDPPNPPAVTETIDGVPVCIQPRHAGGEFATAWTEVPTPSGRRVILSVADSFPGATARREAVATVRATAAADFEALLASHRAWWHALYPRSFVSVPDPKLEGFYWAQIYKLASASRPDRVPVDLLGPWFRDTGWPRIWWNLNIQTLYLPVYTANQPALGESLVRFIDAKRANFVRNAKDIWGFDDCATVPHTTCYEGLRGDGSCAPDKYINPGDFTWALHNVWLHYRHTMDHAMVTNHAKHAFYPLLRGSVNLYLRLLKPGDDGRLHLPVMHSPEYGEAADNNYNLALLRWACQTLLALNERYGLNDSLAPRWRETLEKLTPCPVDETGLRIGADVAFEKSHRHWSHLLAVHPLHIADLDDPATRELFGRSILHWLTVDRSRGVNGWSRAAAASLYAALGDGSNAIAQIHGHMSDARFVRPNTMYIEGSPVIECSIVLARSLQDMLLQSHGGVIRVFPAAPAAWTNAVFHNLSAEGGFLVSAGRADGRTAWVRVRSLAGEPCRVAPGLAGDVKADVPMKPLGNGRYELTLPRGAEALLYAGDTPPRPAVAALPIVAADANPHGLRKPRAARSSLSAGKPAKASSVWSGGFDAAQAFDGDETTRWGAAPGSRSGWIEVDLGAEKEIGRAVVMEIGFPRTDAFAIEARTGDAWKSLVTGTTIAGCRTYDFAPVKARFVRLNITAANEVPTIEEFQLYGAGKP